MMPHAQGKLQAHWTGGIPWFSNLFVRFAPFCGLFSHVVDGRDDPEGKGGDEGCRRDRENPGPNNAAGYAPLYG